MPTYNFLNRHTKEIFQVFMKISELDTYKEEHPHLECVPGKAPALICPIRLGVTKPSQDFTDNLKRIKKNNPGSTIDI